MSRMQSMEDTNRYCRGCDYILQGVTENRCPECGLIFDPTDDRTFRAGWKNRNKAVAVFFLTILPLLLAAATTVGLGFRRGFSCGTPHPPTVKEFAHYIMIQGCGPANWLFQRPSFIQSGLIFLVLWGTWVFLVTRTRMKEIHYIMHFLLPFMWCFFGCGWFAWRVALG